MDVLNEEHTNTITQHAHTPYVPTSCCTNQSVLLHARPVWNPAQLQGLTDRKERVRRKREAARGKAAKPLSHRGRRPNASVLMNWSTVNRWAAV